MPKYIKTTSGNVYRSPAHKLMPNINKTMNFIWIGSEIPPWEAAHIKQFRFLHPHWTVKIWRDEDIFNLPISGRLCRNILPFAASTDIARLEIIHMHGGWYSDLDIEFYKKIDYLCSNRFIFSSETTINSGLYSNAIFGATKKNPILKVLLDYIVTNTSYGILDSSEVLNATGPGVWARILSEYLPVAKLHHSYSSNGGMIVDVNTSEVIAHHKLKFSWKNKNNETYNNN